MRHHAIIVTAAAGHAAELLAAHAQATQVFPVVSAISTSLVNGVRSFFIPPDGSNEEWPGSRAGDARRDAYVRWLDQQGTAENTSPLEWCEVHYGGTSGHAEVVRHSVP